uniref:DNA repair protein RAD51 homolog 4 n=1 Tax=Schistocephalus solidus TaxID=70667 RepID=A0A0X3Q0M7_SCHSO
MASRLAQIVESRLKPHSSPENVLVMTRHCLARVRRQLTPQVQHLTNALIQTRQRIALAASRREQRQTPCGPILAATQSQPTPAAATTTEDWLFYSNLQLIVVDNITAPFAPFTAGFAAEATCHLVQVIAELKRLTADLHIALLVVNNIRYSWSTNRACLGDLWARVPHTSLRMYPVLAPTLRSGVRLIKSQRCKTSTEADAAAPSSCVIDFSEC